MFLCFRARMCGVQNMKTHWPGLWERVERGEIAAIDAFFAENCSFAHEAEALAAADLMQASREGHLCIPAIRNLPHSSVHFENNLLYLQRNWILETKFLSDLKRLQVQEMEVLTPPHLEGLNQKQAQAVSQVFSSSFSIITGGPGTGKTFTAAHLISSFLQAKPDARIAVSAPTGKAASLFFYELQIWYDSCFIGIAFDSYCARGVRAYAI